MTILHKMPPGQEQLGFFYSKFIQDPYRHHKFHAEISETLGLDHFPGLGLENTHFTGLGLSLEYS